MAVWSPSTWLLTGAAVAVGALAVVLFGRLLKARTLTSARREAEQIIERAKSDAQTQKKQIELDARNEIAERREAFEKETEQTRQELKETERRLTKREDSLDRKLDTLSTKERSLEKREREVAEREKAIEGKQKELAERLEQQQRELEEQREEQKQITLRLSGLSRDEARQECLRLMEDEVKHEAAQLIQRETSIAEEQAREKARQITLQAIERFASEHTAEVTVKSVTLPSDDMKGRVIGREGRNIRAFEKATGADLVIDDTPGVVVVSCFEPVRRAIAVETLSRLVQDGRIHPGRIEEMSETVRDEIEQQIVETGKQAAIEANVQGLPDQLVATLGRLSYRTSHGQNVLRHSIEVAYLAQVIADELGLDGAIARRCGLLHDIGKALDHENEGGHPEIGMVFCKKYGEGEEVLNAVQAHHNDVPATTPYTAIVMAADAISGARPGARRESLERYIKRLEQLEQIARGMKGVKEAYAIQAGREVRVIVDPERVEDGQCHVVARDIAREVSEQMTFPGEIRVTVMREMRTVEYAK